MKEKNNTNKKYQEYEYYGLNLPSDKVFCYDDQTFYVTYENRLDTGLFDAWRYSGIYLPVTSK